MASNKANMKKNSKEESVSKIEMPIDKVYELAFDKTRAFRSLMAYYRCAMMEVETKFRVLAEEYSLQHNRMPISTIKSRVKSPESIMEKLARRNLDMTPKAIEENLTDIAGVRVICSFESDVYMLAQSFLMQDDIELIEKKDYMSNPKSNGYRSMHLIIAVPIFLELEKRMMKVEVQLRTIAMDNWAELEHQLRYKKDNLFTDDMAYELKNCANLGEEMDKRMEELKQKIFNDKNEIG